MAKILVYEMYPLAWPGGLPQMTEHLTRVQALGADYVWLAPVYQSPCHDHGYDISDYYRIDRDFSPTHDPSKAIKEFDTFVARAHELGIKVLMDLVLNHTSDGHRWFSDFLRMARDYYFVPYTENPWPEWKSLFDGGSAWSGSYFAYMVDYFGTKLGPYEKYGQYLHLFTEHQPDLRWFFNNDAINGYLVDDFRKIVKFWLSEHKVDGFRLDAVQALNKNFSKKTLEFADLLKGNKAIQVINAVFDGQNTADGGLPFLMAEIFDPEYGDIIKTYREESRVDFCLNVLLKQSADACNSAEDFYDLLRLSATESSFMLDLESHDAPRFLSRVEANPNFSAPADEVEKVALFDTFANAICLYQGQELGLRNPTITELPDEKMLSLDAQTAMRHRSGESLADLRPTSRANARIPLSLEEYARQEDDTSSFLHSFKMWLDDWRNLKVP